MAPSPKSIVVSFDIGKVNMSYCIVEVNNNLHERPLTIIDWNKTNLCEGRDNPTLEEISSLCVVWLKEVFKTNKIQDSQNTWILVERQRPINPSAFALSYTVFTFFMSRYYKTNVSFVSAKSKPIEVTGKKRKRASVRAAKGLLDGLDDNSNNLKWISWFQKQKKTDDLSDSFIQIVGNLHNIKVYEHDFTNASQIIVIDSDDSE